jgi:transmembrane sensor
MSTNRQVARTISEEAAEWLVVLEEAHPADQQAFLAWVRQSPRHVEEFLAATALWQSLRQDGESHALPIEAILAELPDALNENVVSLREHTSPGPMVHRPASRSGRPRLKAWAAAVVLAAALGGAAWHWNSSGSTYATAVGEQRIARLSDGSVLYLNAASQARVRFSPEARDIELIDGEALFVVARDKARPFRVFAGSTVVQAIGTQFNVRRRNDDTRVSVIEGLVRVAKAEQPLAAGEEAVIARDGRITRQELPDVTQAVSWRERRLVFREERLEEIVAEINLHGPRRFVIEGARARDTRLTATFDVDDPESLAAFLQKHSNLDVEAQGENFLIRGH